MPVTSTQNFPGTLTPSFSRTRSMSTRSTLPPSQVRKNLTVEQKKIEAKKKGQTRALERL